MRCAFSPAEQETHVRGQPVILPQLVFVPFSQFRKRLRKVFSPGFGVEFPRLHARISLATADVPRPATPGPTWNAPEPSRVSNLPDRATATPSLRQPKMRESKTGFAPGTRFLSPARFAHSSRCDSTGSVANLSKR